MMSPGRRAHIAIVHYPSAQLSALYGLTDLFQVADRLAVARRGSDIPLLRISHVTLAPDGVGVTTQFDTEPGAGGKPDIAILPPAFGEAPPSGDHLAPILTWLRERHADGTTLAAVCAGSFVLAETGLLAGRSATTHWSFAGLMAERFPNVIVATERLLIEEADVITAGGMMAWTDLGLRIVDRFLGAAAMLETARFLLIDPPGREQSYYSTFVPRLNHGDAAILKVQRWLDANGTRGINVGAMAAEAGLEERTFLRRFTSATGLKPVEYCQHLRVGKARETLETTRDPIDQIGWDVGYDDPASFRKVFHKLTGLTPGDYRRRFGAARASVAAPSPEVISAP